MDAIFDAMMAATMMSDGAAGDSYTKAEADAKFVPKDADDKYLILNGIRLYISSTAPTGDIPDGSIGVGW